MSFTHAEILADFDEVQSYGRKSPTVQVETFWKNVERAPGTVRVFVNAKRKTVPLYRIEPCTVQKSICSLCGGEVEMRQGSNQAIHLGRRACSKRRTA